MLPDCLKGAASGPRGSLFDRLSQSLDLDAQAALPLDVGDTHADVHRAVGLAGRALRASRSGLPVHASLCKLADGTGLLAVGSSSTGKSTLVTLLCHHGATFVSDDTVWLDDRVGTGFGAPIALRKGSPFYEKARALSDEPDEERLLVLPSDLGITSTRSAYVARVVFPKFGAGAAACGPLPPAVAFCLLVGASLRNNVRSDFESLAGLAATVPSAELSYSDNESCMEAVELACSMPTPPPVVISWIDSDELTGLSIDERVNGMRFDDDVALWSSANGRIVHIESWPAGASLADSPALDTLRSLAFLTPERAQ